MNDQPPTSYADQAADAARVTKEPGANSPALHHFRGLGLELHFQDGPIGEHGFNGTTNETVIRVLRDRIDSLNQMNSGMYACKENAVAIEALGIALWALEERTEKRLLRGVEGTSVV
jgi:hypothetical protein